MLRRLVPIIVFLAFAQIGCGGGETSSEPPPVVYRLGGNFSTEEEILLPPARPEVASISSFEVVPPLTFRLPLVVPDDPIHLTIVAFRSASNEYRVRVYAPTSGDTLELLPTEDGAPEVRLRFEPSGKRAAADGVDGLFFVHGRKLTHFFGLSFENFTLRYPASIVDSVEVVE